MKGKNRIKKGFFSEIMEKNIENELTNVYIGFALGVVLLWVYTAIPEQASNAMIYIVMLIVWGFTLSLDLVWDKLQPSFSAVANGIGSKPIKALGFGAIAMAVLSFASPQTIIQPLTVVAPETLSFLFIVLAAPFVEANFFRGLVQPIITQMLQTKLSLDLLTAGGIATIIQSLAFAWFHINIFGATGNFMPYFVFGVIATLGVYFFRSIAFEYGLHGVNNYLAWIAMGGA